MEFITDKNVSSISWNEWKMNGNQRNQQKKQQQQFTVNSRLKCIK